MPLIKGEFVDRRMQSKLPFFYSMVQSAPFAAQGAVADSDVVEIHIDLKSHCPTMTRTLVGC